MDLFIKRRVEYHQCIEKSIELPKRNYAVVIAGTLHLQFFLNGEMQQISFNNPEEIAELLLSFGLIESTEGNGTETRMFKKYILTTTAPNGAPIMSERSYEVKLDHIDFEPAIVHAMAVHHESKRINKIAKLVNMYPEVKQLSKVGKVVNLFVKSKAA